MMMKKNILILTLIFLNHNKEPALLLVVPLLP
jgi:hypothetical protein